MPSSWILHRVVLVRTDILEECIASIIRVTRIGELGTLAVTSNQSILRWNTILLVTANVRSSSNFVTLMVEAKLSSETSVLTTATWRNIPEDGFLLYKTPLSQRCDINSINHLQLTCVRVGQSQLYVAPHELIPRYNFPGSRT
jgi:hypothetical protein